MLLFHLLMKILQDPMYIPMWMVLNSDHTGSHQDFRSERHPADELIDNPTAVFFFLDFFQTENKRDSLKDQNTNFLSTSREEIK